MFIVLEVQKSDVVTTLVSTFDDRDQAEQKYHTILSYAAVSDLAIHSAVMLTEEGYFIKSEHYEHQAEESEEK